MNDDFLIDIDEFNLDPQDGLLPAQEGGLSDQLGVLSPLEGGCVLPPQLSSISPNKWDPRLLLDLVIAVDTLEEILDRYSMTRDEYDQLSTNIVFRRELATTMRDIRENGASFRAKARIQAESYLPVVDDMIWDRDIAPGTRLDAVKSIVRWGDLEPKEKREQVQQVQPQINVQILF